MLDILLKQMELQDVEQHIGIHTNVCENVCRLLKCMVTAARVGLGSHICPIKVREFLSGPTAHPIPKLMNQFFFETVQASV